MNWLLMLIPVAILVVFLFFKVNNMRTKVAYIFILFGMLFIVLSIFFVLFGKSLNFSTLDGLVSAVRFYVSWLVSAVKNVGKVLGYAIHQKWGLNATG